MATINVSWKQYVRHVWLYGFFHTINKTIKNQRWSQMTSFGSRSTLNISYLPLALNENFFFYGVLDTIFKTIDFYCPSKIIKLFLCKIFFTVSCSIAPFVKYHSNMSIYSKKEFCQLGRKKSTVSEDISTHAKNLLNPLRVCSVFLLT